MQEAGAAEYWSPMLSEVEGVEAESVRESGESGNWRGVFHRE